MRREATLWAAAQWAAALLLPACNKLSSEECEGLRGKAFDIVNTAHVCADDSECVPTTWPGCPKPVNAKDKGRIGELQAQFDKGKCVEDKHSCRATPEIYCKQGLCVFRELAGMTNPVPSASKAK